MGFAPGVFWDLWLGGDYPQHCLYLPECPSSLGSLISATAPGDTPAGLHLTSGQGYHQVSRQLLDSIFDNIPVDPPVGIQSTLGPRGTPASSFDQRERVQAPCRAHQGSLPSLTLVRSQAMRLPAWGKHVTDSADDVPLRFELRGWNPSSCPQYPPWGNHSPVLHKIPSPQPSVTAHFYTLSIWLRRTRRVCV